MTQKAFKKGDRVTRIFDWDGKGTIAIREAIVYSCGMKRMVLTDAVTGDEIGREFRPERADLADRATRWGADLTFPALDRDEAIVIALESGVAVAASVRAGCEKRIRQETGNEGFVKAMEQKIANLHEARFVVIDD